MNKYRQLTPEQRYAIYSLNKDEYSLRKIARIISVHPSTVSRELNRNTGGRGYRFKQAQIKANQRRSNAKKHTKLDGSMRFYIHGKIRMYESPEQIVGTAKLKGISIVSTERIYQYIWKDKQEGGDLYKFLRG